ncbi:hypothetical protein [Nitrococcus mobilis]|nr:hypothetical protein [Nitrococcus mobilis]
MLLSNPVEMGGEGESSLASIPRHHRMACQRYRSDPGQLSAARLITFVGLMISHGYSFVTNFLLVGEKDRPTINHSA